MQPLPLAHTLWLKPYIDYLKTLGVAYDRLLRSAHIAEGAIDDPYGWIGRNQVYDFLNPIVKETGIENLGYIGGNRIDLDGFQSLWRINRDGCTFHEELNAVCSLIPQLAEDNVMTVADWSKGLACLQVKYLPGLEKKQIVTEHFTLMFLVQLIRLVAGEAWVPKLAYAQCSESDAHTVHREFDRCQIHFDAPYCGVVFPAEFLAVQRSPFERSGECDGIVGTSFSKNGVGERILCLLSSYLKHGDEPPSLSAIANFSHMSERTLQRRLNEEQLSYRELVDKARFEQATRLLIDTSMSVSDMSDRLGYSGANNFDRFFTRVSGVTPTQFRKERRA